MANTTLSRYTTKSDSEQFTFNLVILKNKKRKKENHSPFEQHLVFVTFLPCNDKTCIIIKSIPAKKDAQWKPQNQSAMPHTCSKDTAVQMSFPILSFVINNIWVGLCGENIKGRYTMALAHLVGKMIIAYVNSAHARWLPPEDM